MENDFGLSQEENEFNEDRRNKILGAIARVIGGVPALVLFNLIENFPSRMVMIDDSAWMRADLGAATKLKLDTKLYYEAINALIGSGFIFEVIDSTKKHFFKINFEMLEKFSPKKTTNSIEYEILDGSD